MEREREAEDRDRPRPLGGPAGDPGSERTAAGDERQAGELPRAQAVDDGDPGSIELARRRRSAPPDDAVGLLDERDRESLCERGLRRGDEISRRHPTARAMAEDEPAARILGRTEMDSRRPVRSLHDH
jgi:hypothetical protein